MRVAIAQLNPTVGDFSGNLSKIRKTLTSLEKDAPDLVVFPELFLTGCPPKDLLERGEFIRRAEEALQEVIQTSKRHPKSGILIGTVLQAEKKVGKGSTNSAVLAHDGRVIGKVHKSLLPNYDVFDEARYFDPSPEIRIIAFGGEFLGVSICEDAWNDPAYWGRQVYPIDPIEIQSQKGATIFINISASPFHIGKEEIRYRLVRNHALKFRTPFLYVNMVGGNDELIFDGRSFCVDRDGELIGLLPSFEPCVRIVDTERSHPLGPYVFQDRTESVYQALILGLKDYMRKCHFSKVLLGLSGGIDSAVTCCIGREAAGRENVLAISMPSQYSSASSVEDSKKLAENLGIEYRVIPISSIFASYQNAFKKHFEGRENDTTEENIQARIRGNILMAFSNKFGHLLLSTGNKSELAVGYCTLYGDMSGGISVISDVPKTMVYELARYINQRGEMIPKRILEKAPSAELKPNQLDQDILPPYEVLDEILRLYLDEEYSEAEIISHNLPPETVHHVLSLVNKNEYKRRQSPPGLKVTTKAFGWGRRMPIAARYED
jgi:NAD+ synthase (glutamine-hydrolysing)